MSNSDSCNLVLNIILRQMILEDGVDKKKLFEELRGTLSTKKIEETLKQIEKSLLNLEITDEEIKYAS